TVGELVSWPPGEGQYNVLDGHTASVVEVDSGNGTYIVSEMNYTSVSWEVDYRVVGMANPDVPTIAVPIATGQSCPAVASWAGGTLVRRTSTTSYPRLLNHPGFH